MNWKVVSIILIIVVVLLAAYSYGLFPGEKTDEELDETSESFDVSASIQSDFWDGFGVWLWANLWWLCLAGVAMFAGKTYLDYRN